MEPTSVYEDWDHKEVHCKRKKQSVMVKKVPTKNQTNQKQGFQYLEKKKKGLTQREAVK